MKSKLAISLLLCLVSSSGWCVCQVPQPRLVCAEYSQSNAVVIAKLTGVTNVPKDYPDYFIFSFVVVRQFRGQTPRKFEIYEGNDSGRAAFNWRLNDEYLLFLQKGNSVTHNDWFIDGCGNSGPLADAGPALNKIRRRLKDQKDGTIAGMVGMNSWSTGMSGVAVEISGNHRLFKLKTDASGRFSQEVPIGAYKINAKLDGTAIPVDLFSYENPDHIVIAPGGCAQVQFTK